MWFSNLLKSGHKSNNKSEGTVWNNPLYDARNALPITKTEPPTPNATRTQQLDVHTCFPHVCPPATKCVYQQNVLAKEIISAIDKCIETLDLDIRSLSEHSRSAVPKDRSCSLTNSREAKQLVQTLRSVLQVVSSGDIVFDIVTRYMSAKKWKNYKCSLESFTVDLSKILQRHIPSQDSMYDIRGNARQYTLQESLWAKSALDKFNLSLISSWLQRLSLRYMLESPSGHLHSRTYADYLSASKLPFELTLGYFKCLNEDIPNVTRHNIASYSPKELFLFMRSKSYFKQRGRTEMPEYVSRQRRNSYINNMSGIAAMETLGGDTSLKLYQTGNVLHAKNVYTRRGNSEYGADEFFRKRNIPFISGAAGGLSYHLAVLFSSDGVNDFTKEQLEQIVLFIAVTNIYYGHHSLLECLIVAQSVFLFEDLPSIVDSMEHPGFYQEFTRQFSSYIKQRYHLPEVF